MSIRRVHKKGGSPLERNKYGVKLLLIYLSFKYIVPTYFCLLFATEINREKCESPTTPDIL